MSDVDDLTLGEVLEVVERLYPPSTAQSWDRVGLVTGDLRQPVRRIHLAVDPTLAVIEEARALGADLLLTHHPLLLRGVHGVAGDQPDPVPRLGRRGRVEALDDLENLAQGQVVGIAHVGPAGIEPTTDAV